MNVTQIQAVLAPLVLAAAGWLASHFPLLDQATWNTLITTIAFAASTAFVAFITKKTSLANTVASKGTIVVTDEKTAAAVPNTNVVSNTEVEVVKK